jgi:hypothetical protein
MTRSAHRVVKLPRRPDVPLPRPLGLDHLQDPGHLVGVHEESARTGIIRRPTPLGASVESGENDGPIGARRQPRLMRQDLSPPAKTAARAAGVRSVMISSPNHCRENGGGFSGTGCVGQAASPDNSDFGAGRSSIGNTGVPVSRSNT